MKNKNNEKKVLNELQKYRNKDFAFKSGRILSSMCTQPFPIAKKAYMSFLETNLGDPELFPGTREIESKYLSFIAELLNAPTSFCGIIGSGGTESNITAIWIAKNLTGKKEVIIPESAHFSFEKIAMLMDMKLIPIPLTKKYIIDMSKVQKKINKETAAVVGIAGSTELGMIDPIPDLSDICLEENVFLQTFSKTGMKSLIVFFVT
jgi:tyrosine decarboxylase/aspartate 1-decarboxylase